MSKRLQKAHKAMTLGQWFDKTKTDAKKLAERIKAMPRKKLIIITGAVALTGITGYLVVRAYIKRYDGKNYFLKGFSKSKSKADALAEILRKKGMLVRVDDIKIFNTTVHRVYARKA